MSRDTVTPSTRMRDSAFGALITATFGLILLEAGSLMLQARVSIHIVNFLLGTVLISIPLRRFLQYWPPANAASSSIEGEGQRYGLVVLRATSSVAIGSAGYFASDILTHGFVSLFMFFVCGLIFLPWTKIANTRRHCLGYWLASAIGIGAALVGGYGRLNPILLIAATWLLWMSAIASWCHLVLDERKRDKAAHRVSVQFHSNNADSGHALRSHNAANEML